MSFAKKKYNNWQPCFFSSMDKYAQPRHDSVSFLKLSIKSKVENSKTFYALQLINTDTLSFFIHEFRYETGIRI